jgi:hypothetical protein
VLGGFGLGCGVLWVGAGEGRAVGDVQQAGKKRGGVLGAASSSPPFLMARVGAGGAGLDRGTVQEHGNRVWASKNSDRHSELDSLDFSAASVQRNARKRFKFEFLKTSTLGDQHTSPGFQIYFCYQEWFSLAEIYISKWDMVTISDSKFSRCLSKALV